MKQQPDLGINVIPVDQFNSRQQAAFALAGTVALPSPPPASGPLFLGRNPDCPKSFKSVIPKFYLKSIQRVSDKQLVNRIFDLEDLRAVGLPGPNGSGTGSPRRLLVADDDEVARAIQTGIGKLQQVAGQEGPDRSFEIELFSCAVVHVGESAPVLTQVQYEFGVTAAESAENVSYLGGGGGSAPCC